MLFAAALLASPQIWTVDDDAPADFATLAQAFAGVSPGDTLLVMPGTYAAEPLTIDLRIVGPTDGPRPLIAGTFRVTGAADFVLCGLAFESLMVTGIVGRGRIDDCGVSDSIEVLDSHVIEILRTTAEGEPCYGSVSSCVGKDALTVTSSTVEVVDCWMRGGDADPIGFSAVVIVGGAGLVLSDGSAARVSGTTVHGGDGYGAPTLVGAQGHGGRAIEVLSASQLDLRGSSSDVVWGGTGDSTTESPLLVSFPSGSALSWSGLTLGPGFTYPDYELMPAAPYLVVHGPGVPGTAKRVKLYGQAGSPAVLALSLAPAYFAVPGLPGGALGLDPASVVAWHFGLAAGQDVEHTWLIALPPDPSLAGTCALVQGAVALDFASWWLTNFGSIVLRS